MPREGYVELKVSSGQAWLLLTRIRDLQKVDSIFFDCDGVLVDVRDSYDATIIETVRLLAKGLMGIDLPESMPSRKSILELKKSGGFNNDWSISYALLLGILSYYPKRVYLNTLTEMTSQERERILKERTEQSTTPADPGSASGDLWTSVDEAIARLARKADSTGISSLQKILAEDGQGENVTALKRLLGYPVEASIVGRVFDEFFYGQELFRRKFRTEPIFNASKGFVEKETPAISQDALRRLKERVGRERIGVISGRDQASAEKTLGQTMNEFDHKNLLFLLTDPDYSGKRMDDSEPHLSKPDPQILALAVQNLQGAKHLLYVGDSAEDLMMVQRANQTTPRFLFAGVYGLANFKEETCSYFLDRGADAVLPSVNDLPELLDAVGGWK